MKVSSPMYEDAKGATFGIEGDFLVWVDETGQETFADARHPVFGFGACAAPFEAVEALMFRPWSAFKTLHFGSTSHPLHACKLKKSDVTPERSKAARTFFRENLFFRAAAIARSNTTFHPKLGLNPAYRLVAQVFGRRVVEMFKWSASKRVVVIFEASQRLDPLADAFFAPIQIWEGNTQIPVALCRMGKGDLGLEIADFIAHAAGRKARVRAGAAPSRFELVDGESIFAAVPPKYVSYFDVDAADWTPSAPV